MVRVRALRRPRRAAVVSLWEPTTTFDDRRAADATLVCLIIFLHFHLLHDFAINGCLSAK